jgi:hypothetical protein
MRLRRRALPAIPLVSITAAAPPSVSQSHRGGRLSKQIAHDIGIAENTVKVRRRAMQKMEAGSLPEPAEWPTSSSWYLTSRNAPELYALRHALFARADRRSAAPVVVPAIHDPVEAIKRRGM